MTSEYIQLEEYAKCVQKCLENVLYDHQMADDEKPRIVYATAPIAYAKMQEHFKNGSNVGPLITFYQSGIEVDHNVQMGAWKIMPVIRSEGYNKVFVKNDAVKSFLTNQDIQANDRILIEITPQLLNRNKELVQKLAGLVKSMKALFVFDEAHFTEQTDKTKEIVKTITDDDAVNQETLQDFNTIPWVYLTASPDTQSLQNVFSVDNDNYYELTKEVEWQLYLEDLKKPADQREFDYVPVRNCLYVMDKIFDSVFNSATSKKQDYTSLYLKNSSSISFKHFSELLNSPVIGFIK